LGPAAGNVALRQALKISHRGNLRREWGWLAVSTVHDCSGRRLSGTNTNSYPLPGFLLASLLSLVMFSILHMACWMLGRWSLAGLEKLDLGNRRAMHAASRLQTRQDNFIITPNCLKHDST
jgi:hypothetical protein